MTIVSERKFEKLVYSFKPEYNEIVPEDTDANYVVSPQAYFRGACEIPGSQYNVGFQIFVKPFFLDRNPHMHEHDEYLIFMGGTFPNVFDFNADIELTLGKGDEAELYKICAPTIIRIPAGVWHCPLNFKRVDKPVFFQAALMQGSFGGTYETSGGIKEIYYNGPIECVLHPGKKCNVCKECLTADWKK
jgi:hypothetical protein